MKTKHISASNLNELDWLSASNCMAARQLKCERCGEIGYFEVLNHENAICCYCNAVSRNHKSPTKAELVALEQKAAKLAEVIA